MINDDEPPLKIPQLLWAIGIIVLLILSGQEGETKELVVENRQESVIYANSPHFLTEKVTLGALMDRIIECESSGNPNAINSEYGCNGGMGLAQLIPKTVKYCEEKLDKKIDPFDPEDNLECAMYLLKNEGSRHWGTADTDWGTYWCWK